MIILSWNCRGLGSAATVPALCELVRARHPDVIVLFEILSYGVRLETLRVQLHFNNCLVVDCISHSGGVAVLWSNKISCSVLSYSSHHIDMHVAEAGGDWCLTGFYGYPDRGHRHLSPYGSQVHLVSGIKRN